MKPVRILTATVALALVVGGLTARAEDGEKEGPRHGPGPGPMLEHLLPPRVVDELNLTTDQKSKLADLESAFKKDAEAWRKAHVHNPEESRKAREADDKDSLKKLADDRRQLMDTRKNYVDKFRASLTDEQKKKLDDHLSEMRERHGKGPRGEKHDGPPPPPEN